mgnify:CR=1 FL=1|tara:strand:+ start:747 stop:1217 length:471 start_codon:yes stop_codon:yes gene_type:complete
MITETILPKIIVKKSSIHGSGVFAAEHIKEGQKIVEYQGEKIPTEEGDKRSEIDEKLTYIFVLNDEYDVDGSVNGNEARLVNHSCDPNAYTDIIDDKIWIIADRDIAEGEEIAYDYSFDADELEECRCGSEKCRGYINEPDSEDTKKLLEKNGKKV